MNFWATPPLISDISEKNIGRRKDIRIKYTFSFKLKIQQTRVHSMNPNGKSFRYLVMKTIKTAYFEGLSFHTTLKLITNNMYCNVFIRPSSDGTYYGMVMSVRPGLHPTLRPSVRLSVRPGLRPPVFHTFLLHALTHWAEILHMTLC